MAYPLTLVSIFSMLVVGGLVPARCHSFGDKVQAVETHSAMKELFKDAGARPVIIMFWTETCGFCHMMMPFFEQQAENLATRAYFRKVNIRTNPESAAILDADGLPNFKFIIKGKVVKSMRGASVEGLEKYITNTIEKADQEDIVITREDLIEYFEKYDPSVASDTASIDMLLETGLQNKAKMLELLHGQYGAKPKYLGGFVTKTGSKDAKAPASGSVEDEVARLKAELKQLDKQRSELPAAKDTSRADLGKQCPERVSFRESSPERVVILGGGPAGASAALYTGRAMLCPVMVSPQLGGQLMAKGVDVENYPGLPQAMGGEIVSAMRSQATAFHSRFLDDAVVEVDFAKRPFALKTNKSGTVFADAVIIATGATSRVLGVPGESQFYGKGISGCATCDGYLYRGRKCLVVGGGDAALEDALHLTRICTSVTLVHRRHAFRAGQGLRLQVTNNEDVHVRWNTEVKAFHGDDKVGLQKAVLRNVHTGVKEELHVGAAFVAIGHDPNTNPVRGQLKMDTSSGYITCKGRTTHTSVAGVFAAGDVADSRYRQAVTSAGAGAAAALDAERWLAEQSKWNPTASEDAPSEAEAQAGDSSLHDRILIALIFVAFAVGQASESKFGFFRRLLGGSDQKTSLSDCDVVNGKQPVSEPSSKQKSEKAKMRGKVR